MRGLELQSLVAAILLPWRWERLQLPNIYHEDEVRTAEIRVERYTEAGLSVTLFELLDQALFNFRILSYTSLLYTFPLLYKLL